MTTKSHHPKKHATEQDVEVVPIDMQDVIAEPEPVVHDTEPPTVGEVPAILPSDIEAEAVKLEQSGRPGAAAKLRAAAAGAKS